MCVFCNEQMTSSLSDVSDDVTTESVSK